MLIVSYNFVSQMMVMVEEKLLVRLSGVAAEVLNELVRRGYFATKSKAIRAGILRLGENFSLFKPYMHYWRELGEEIRRTRRKTYLTPKEFVKLFGLKPYDKEY